MIETKSDCSPGRQPEKRQQPPAGKTYGSIAEVYLDLFPVSAYKGMSGPRVDAEELLGRLTELRLG